MRAGITTHVPPGLPLLTTFVHCFFFTRSLVDVASSSACHTLPVQAELVRVYVLGRCMIYTHAEIPRMLSI